MRRPSHRGLTLVELIITLGVLAVLTSLAIPAYVKYQRRARTAEVFDGLASIAYGARLYFVTEHYALDDGHRLPRQFPTSVPRTPATKCCEQTATGGRCSGTSWYDWRYLSFQMENWHWYQYEFISAGSEKDAVFTARGIGDQDCDGIEAVWQRFGTIGRENDVVFGTPYIVDPAREVE